MEILAIISPKYLPYLAAINYMISDWTSLSLKNEDYNIDGFYFVLHTVLPTLHSRVYFLNHLCKWCWSDQDLLLLTAFATLMFVLCVTYVVFYRIAFFRWEFIKWEYPRAQITVLVTKCSDASQSVTFNFNWSPWADKRYDKQLGENSLHLAHVLRHHKYTLMQF